jgi:hypothetical protein
MEFKIEVTWSKLTALIMLLLAAYIDIKIGISGTVFMFALPFVVFLITGKQYLDKK